MKNCKVPIEEQQFNKNKARKDGLNTICRECSKIRSKQYYKDNPTKQKREVRKRAVKILSENRQKLWDYYSEHPCVDCGESNPVVLELDHVSGCKKDNIAVLIGGCYSWATIENEISKCEVRCANCHRIKTAKQFGWYKGVKLIGEAAIF